MKNELTENYTNVCWFCGTIYKSNRSTSKYCCKKHNSLHAKYGSQIKPLTSEMGEIMDFENVLYEIFCEIEEFTKNGWGVSYAYRAIREDFDYQGPLPTGDELVLVGSYLIGMKAKQTIDKRNIYYVKPFKLLTLEEKMRMIIVQGKV